MLVRRARPTHCGPFHFSFRRVASWQRHGLHNRRFRKALVRRCELCARRTARCSSRSQNRRLTCPTRLSSYDFTTYHFRRPRAFTPRGGTSQLCEVRLLSIVAEVARAGDKHEMHRSSRPPCTLPCGQSQPITRLAPTYHVTLDNCTFGIFVRVVCRLR